MIDPAATGQSEFPVRVAGTGSIRVLVSHGWISDHTIWDPFIARLDGTRFTWAFPDHRGYGLRRDEAGPRSMLASAHDALAAADRLGWPRFHVVGHSMGGMVAQRLLLDAPGRVASVSLLAPVPACGAQIASSRRELLLRAIADSEARRALIVANTGGRRPAEWIEPLLALSLRTTQADALAAYLESWSVTDFSDDVRPAAVPVLLVLGEVDGSCAPARMAETIIRWHPHTEQHVLCGIGHYPMWEAPDELHRLLIGHLALAEQSPPRPAPANRNTA